MNDYDTIDGLQKAIKEKEILLGIREGDDEKGST